MNAVGPARKGRSADVGLAGETYCVSIPLVAIGGLGVRIVPRSARAAVDRVDESMMSTVRGWRVVARKREGRRGRPVVDVACN